MSRRQRQFLHSGILILFASAQGCGTSDIPAAVSGSSEEATIKGKVLVNGKPVKAGELTFRVANVNRPGAANRKATINADGTYEVKTLVGQNYVEVYGIKELQTPKMRRFLDDDTSLHVPSGGSESMDIHYPPNSGGAPK